MTAREIMAELLETGRTEKIPMCFLGFSGMNTLRRVVPNELINDYYDEYPCAVEGGEYGFDSVGHEAIDKAIALRKHICGCALPVGRGTGLGFGHGGPGEFDKKIIERSEKSFKVEYETGAKKLVNIDPYFTHTYEHHVEEEEDLDTLTLPDADDPRRYEGFAKDVAYAKSKGEWTVGYVNGFFSGCHYFLMDYEDTMVNLLMEPEMMHRMVNMLGEWNLRAAKHMCEAGVDCIGFCDDLGSGQSMLISPKLYREYFKPWHKKLCDLVHSYGVVVHMHSHGAIMPILKDIVETGVDILNPVDPDDHMPLDEVKAITGDKMIISGGMDKHFWDWDRERKHAFLEDIMNKGRKYGRFIFMDSGGIPENVTKEEFDDFLDMYRELC